MDPLQGRTILCLATQEWDAHWTPVQQIMLRLAPCYRVIYVEPFHPFGSNHRSPSASNQASTQRLREVSPNLFVYKPSRLYLPFNMRSRMAHFINSFLYHRELRSLVLSLGGPFVLWAFFAQSLSVLDLPFEHVIYDCVDDWPSFFPEPREKQHVTHIDEGLCRRADLVFVGSLPLQEKKAPLNSHLAVVNHAADIEHFGNAADQTGFIPPDLASLRRPRLGFVGMIDRVRFDADLILTLARDYEMEIALVGGAMPGAEDLLPPDPHIHWLGMHAVADLPDYLRGMDVLLMPYALNEATRNIYPLKLFEYLATGKPVVTTAIPAVEPLRHLMYVADSREDFFNLVARAIAEKDPGLVRLRRMEAATHTWEAHLSHKLRVVKETFGATAAPATRPDSTHRLGPVVPSVLA